MRREIKLYTIDPDGSISWLSGMAARAGLGRLGKGDGIITDGCGMDMGFHLVYTLGRMLWPDGYQCHGTSCRSNDHSNGDRNREPHQHNDGGYALQSRWL